MTSVSNSDSGQAPKKPGRITSLDIARGWFLMLSVSSASIVDPRPSWLIHAKWFGIQPYDLIFPLFVTLSGIGMAFAYRNRVSILVTLRRIVVLTVAGLLYYAVATDSWDWDTMRYPGTLQLYAVLIAIVAVLHPLLKKWWAWAIFTLVWAGVMAGFLAWWASSCPGGALSAQCNPSKTIDTAIFGLQHLYHGGIWGHDPEGIVAILGALITASAGITAGHFALDARTKPWYVGPPLLFAWAGFISLYGYALSWAVPAFKRLWTPSFALPTAAIGIVIFAAAFWVFDMHASGKWQVWREKVASPFVAFGRNSLLVYFGSHLLVDVAARTCEPSLAQRIAQGVSFESTGRWGFVLLNVFLWWGFTLILHRAKLYVHA